jgi:hypothetical protein
MSMSTTWPSWFVVLVIHTQLPLLYLMRLMKTNVRKTSLCLGFVYTCIDTTSKLCL